MSAIQPNDILLPSLQVALYEGEPFDRILLIVRHQTNDIWAIPLNFDLTTLYSANSPMKAVDSAVFISSATDHNIFYPLEVKNGTIYEKISWYQAVMDNWNLAMNRIENREQLTIRMPVHLKVLKKEGVRENSYTCRDRVLLPYQVSCDLEGVAEPDDCCVFMISVTNRREEYAALYNSTTKKVIDGKNYFK
jgi:hypothetical protein